MTKVSVVIAAYNAATFVESAVQSALAQKGVSLEVLVVDDASQDATRKVLAGLAQGDPRIIPIHAKVNGGPASARNLAIRRAEGDWIAVLDSDDAFAPNRLRDMIDAGLSADAEIVLDDFVSVDTEGTVLSDTSLVQRRMAGSIDIEAWVGLNNFARGEMSFGYAKPLIARSFIDRTGLRYDEALRNGEDFHLVLNALVAGAEVYFTAQPGYRYTRRSGSVSRRAQDDHMHALLAADDAVAARLDPSAKVQQLLRKRRGNLTKLVTTEAVLGALKARRPREALGRLMREPHAIGRVIGHLGEAVGKRIRPSE